jgi:uracil-DNA glycosylase
MTLFDDPADPDRPPPPIPERLSFKALREAVQGCSACELWEDATQGLERAGIGRGDAYNSDLANLVIVTTHPSAILRQRDEAARGAAMDAFVQDLQSGASWLTEHGDA